MKKPANSNSFPLPKAQLIADYRLAYRSRQAAIIGRREVLTGKATTPSQYAR